jgi:phage terminase large subunit-like protein
MFRVAAEAGTNDGGLPTAFLADEIHEWVGRKARVHLVIGNSLAKRSGGLEINISTPDDADPASLLGSLVAYGERVAGGEVSDPSFLYVRYSAPLETRLEDPVALRAALRACHPASWLDLERVAARWEQDRIPEHEFRRYHLAQFVRPQSAWLPEGAWAACADSERVVPDGSEIMLGFDGSYNQDSTGLVACTIEEQPHVFVLGVWERPGGSREWIVPRDEVSTCVKRAFERYQVVEMLCDPPGWHRELDEWGQAYGSPPLISYPTNQRKMMSEACSRLYTAIVTKAVTHDGNPRLAAHMANAVTKETPDGAYITKESRSSRRKIDLAVAAVIAFGRASTLQSEPWVAAW